MSQWLAGDPGEKGFRAGTDRLIAPSETLARAARLMAVAGVTRVADLTGLDHLGIPVAAAYRPNARSVSVSQGKGVTREAARASALMEALEGYHAERIANPLRLATVREMRPRPDVVPLERLPRTTTPLDEQAKLLWVEGEDLATGGSCWLPIEVVQTDFTWPVVGCSGAFLMSSNGLASGNHPLEAVSHAVCEVVERDANSLWSLASEEVRGSRLVDLSTLSTQSTQSTTGSAPAALLAKLAEGDVAVAVWETTSDVGIPSYLCQLVDRHPRGFAPLPPTVGTGCHPRREVAFLRAVTEAAQGRLTRIAAVREDLDEVLYDAAATEAAIQRALAAELRPVRPFGAAPSFEGATFADDVRWELGQLRGAGIASVVVVDLGRPELGLPVVRAVIPGLEGMSEIARCLPGERAERCKTAR